MKKELLHKSFSIVNSILDEDKIFYRLQRVVSIDILGLLVTNGISSTNYVMKDDGLFFYNFQKFMGLYFSKRYLYCYSSWTECLYPNRRESLDESLMMRYKLDGGVYYICPDKWTILEMRLGYNDEDDTWNFDFKAIGKNAEKTIKHINTIWHKMKYKTYKSIIEKTRRLSVNECLVYRTQNGPKKKWTTTQTVFKDISNVICIDKDYLLSRIDKFMVSEDSYTKRDVPYRLGILLYGPPGTGKTTLSLSLADYVGAHLIINVTLSSLTEIRMFWNEKYTETITLGAHVKKQSRSRRIVFIIEEIDQWFDDNDDVEFKSEKIHELLQLIDSLDNQAFIIATTNHFDSLSDALIRDGRFDIKMCMGEFNRESALEFISTLKSDAKILDMMTPDENGNYSPVEIQNLALQMRLESIHEELDIINKDE